MAKAPNRADDDAAAGLAMAAFRRQLRFWLVALALITRQADLLFVLLSWVFVALRVFHAYIMVTTNYVPRRARVHFAALAILVLMWAIFALHILLAI